MNPFRPAEEYQSHCGMLAWVTSPFLVRETASAASWSLAPVNVRPLSARPTRSLSLTSSCYNFLFARRVFLIHPPFPLGANYGQSRDSNRKGFSGHQGNPCPCV